MTKEIQISKTAVSSLVFGLIFFVPLVCAFFAIIFGYISRRNIKHSEGRLLGSGLALSGIILGLIQLTLWLLFLYTDMTYIVNATENAVITRTGNPVRVEEPGIHFKIPFYEEVTRFPADKIFKFEGRSIEMLLIKNRQFISIDADVLWQICDPIQLYKKSSHFNEKIINERIYTSLTYILREEALSMSNITDITVNSSFKKEIENMLQNEINKFGICHKMIILSPSKN